MKQVVLLSTDGENCDLVANFLASKGALKLRINEKRISRKFLFRRRIKKLGFFKVFGQVLFITLVSPLLSYFSKKRIIEIKQKNNLNYNENINYNVSNVSNINSEKVVSMVYTEKPDIVIVFGTRIIKEAIFSKFGCPIYNMHVGITPAYRGVHGGYWSLVNNDKENFGVTIHQIDAGIDTGMVEYQATSSVESSDNFSTYPLLQVIAGLNLIEKLLNGMPTQKISNNESVSRLYYHPTLMEYLKYRILEGVK